MTDEAPSLPTNPVDLTGAQRRYLRGLGHTLKPVVRVGKNGVTSGVVEAAAVALDDHELIKVAIPGVSKARRKVDAEAIARGTGSHVAQLLGGTALLYRRRLDGAEIPLPGAFEVLDRTRRAPSGDPEEDNP